MEQENIEYKIILLGESGVGKTSIIKKLDQKEFDNEEITSSAPSFVTKEIKYKELGNEKILLNIWDTAGQEKFRSLQALFYKDADAVVLVYDVTSASSFEELANYWLNEVKGRCCESIG